MQYADIMLQLNDKILDVIIIISEKVAVYQISKICNIFVKFYFQSLKVF